MPEPSPLMNQERTLAALAKKVAVLEASAGNGGDGGGGGMDAWQTAGENRLTDFSSSVREVRSEIRTLTYWTVGGFLAVLSALAGGFLWLADKLPS